jgi:beta-lactamase superfamily II metal-dependent hydrolase
VAEARYVTDVGGRFKVPLKSDAGRTIATLLWGDRVRVIETQGDRTKIQARGQQGWVPASAVGDEGLLEVYVIDVGQGDGVLMRTPDDSWHLIDAGIANTDQMTKKGTANFLRWKFLEDLELKKVSLENVIVTHPDYDHYGGLFDLLAGKLYDGRTFPIEVGNFYHCGMGRFAAAPKLGKTVEGTVADIPNDDYDVGTTGRFIVELLDGKGTFTNPSRSFEESFGKLAKLVATVPKKVRRLSAADEHLPGYAPGDGEVTIAVLGPVAEDVPGQGPGLRVLGGESITRNGHSVVLRVECGKARLLLTGDLNAASQRLLLSYHDGREFAADVAKACHHGSDDFDLRFARVVSARATVISSGDNEDYAHPRPIVLGASARYGREAKGTDGETLPPLIYSTELARSVRLDFASAVREKGAEATEIEAKRAEIRAAKKGARYRSLARTPISTDLIYGLINVRTDGERILCGYMKEKGSDFDILVFRAGVEA